MMKHIIPTKIALLFVLFSHTLLAQQMKFKTLTTDEGLSNNSVNDIISDEDGRLWIATWDGLNVYDGNQIQVFKHQFQDSTSIAGNVILAFKKDKNGRIWMLNDNNSISYYQGDGVFKNFKLDQNAENLRLTKSGEIAVKTSNSYFAWQNNHFQAISGAALQTENSYKPLQKLLEDQFPNVLVNDVLKDREGNIWYASRKNGLFFIANTPQNLNNQQITQYTYDPYSPYSFASNEIEKLYEDDFGNIWLAHKDGGISMTYRGAEQITTVTPHPKRYPHLPNETIRGITKDQSGSVWLGYYNHGLFYFSKKTNCYVPFSIQEALLNSDWNRIRSLYTDSEGIIWVGTYAGIIKIENHQYSLISAEDFENFPANRNYSFFEDSVDLWIACWGGVAKYNRKSKRFEEFKHQEELASFHVRQLIKKDDTLVLATEHSGVIFFSTEKGILKTLDTENGLLGNSVYSLYQDSTNDGLWIATLGGISIYKNSEGITKNLTETDGLPSHMVYSLLANGNEVWISTTKGIAFINKKSYAIKQLPKEQGWQAQEFSEGASFQDAKGTLFFGGINGLSFFQPDAYHYTKKPTKFFLKVDGKENYSAEFTKEYHQNSVAVTITPISYTGLPQTIWYKLEGADSDWKAFKNSEIVYRHLQPGDYSFKITSNKKEDQATQYFQLHIEKPFYQTFWFYAACIVLLILIGICFSVRRNRVAKKIRNQLEKNIEERTAVIASQKKELVDANKNLEQKNAEIAKQKEKLLALHRDVKNKDFEVEKFQTFFLSDFKSKLNKIVALLKSEENDTKSVENELTKLIEDISEWDYLDQISELGESVPVQIDFEGFITKIYQQISDNQYNTETSYKFSKISVDILVALDVLRFRLLLRYLIIEVFKYSGSNEKCHLQTSLHANKAIVELKASSELLKKEWQNITNFSPYYKAFQLLLKEISGEIEVKFTEDLEITLQIPVTSVKNQSEASGVLQYKHLQQPNNDDKSYMLVYCEEDDISFLSQLLNSKDRALLFEHDLHGITSAIHQCYVETIIIYNIPFSNDFEQVLHQPALQRIPSLYISETISLSIEERAIENGINAIANLPTSSDLLNKKIAMITNSQKQAYSTKIDRITEKLDRENVVLNPHEKTVKKALKIIEEELDNPQFNVDSLFKRLEISRTKVYRVFKEILQQSPSDVIINLRLQKAENLLLTGNLNISEISFECGFNDPKYFSRLFKKHYGESPKRYKKHIQNTLQDY
ncbi:two-component regulator propeller domain-containing protein [Zunongwangia endophytica]|uniref:Two-component regulator propeller domain-containing protein n=1 Tax=Zunongwangia endophytica TaxID=1808945 RepID=A0ABV8HAA7_9FLAO|nr:two-component regulator propeller domain-containing protein [Zunongwangia endophytica]MDN3594794.1 two-component regulator propeller domain-containing protein [Zunongwangia endophytica]